MAGPQRREFLGLALGGRAGGRGGLQSVAPGRRPNRWPSPVPFAADTVLKAAAQLAAAPFKAPERAAAQPLFRAHFRAIRLASAASRERRSGPTRRSASPSSRCIAASSSRRRWPSTSSRTACRKGSSTTRPTSTSASCSRPLRWPISAFPACASSAMSDQGFQDVAIFQGASFYRSRARGQNFGVTARGLAIRTGDEPGEEFPLFREFWVEKPTPGVQHADHPRAARLGERHGRLPLHHPPARDDDHRHRNDADRARADRQARHRRDGGHYLFSGLDHRRPDDWRAAVYEVTGLQMLSGKDEWLWRPVANRETLQISAFADVNPRGFGLLQRSRSFDAFYDDEGRWELRPTLWIEPIGEWGDGDVRLLEIPAAVREQRQHHRPVAPEGGHCGGQEPVVRLPAVLVLDAALASRRWPSARRAALGKAGEQAALRRRNDRRRVRRPAESRGGRAPTSRPTPARSFGTGSSPIRTGDPCASFSTSIPDRRPIPSCGSSLKVDNQAVSETWLYRWTA